MVFGTRARWLSKMSVIPTEVVRHELTEWRKSGLKKSDSRSLSLDHYFVSSNGMTLPLKCEVETQDVRSQIPHPASHYSLIPISKWDSILVSNSDCCHPIGECSSVILEESISRFISRIKTVFRS